MGGVSISITASLTNPENSGLQNPGLQKNSTKKFDLISIKTLQLLNKSVSMRTLRIKGTA
jgi:hypothetical protein